MGTNDASSVPAQPSEALAPVREMAEGFIGHLTGNPNAPVTIQTFPEPKGAPSSVGPQVIHGTVAGLWPEIERLNRSGHGIFVMVNEGDGRGRAGANVIALRAVFVDDDSGALTPDDPRHSACPPSIVVQSSQGKHHYYWTLSPGEPLDAFTPAQVQLASHFGTDGTVKDLPRVMRLPGTLHLKDREAPVLVTLVRADGGRRTLSEVLAAFPANVSPVAPVPAGAISNGDGSESVNRARTDISSIQAVQGQFGDRTTFIVACILVNDYGLSEAAAWDLLAEWNRTNATPPWSEKDLRAKLKSAVNNAKYPAGSRLDGDHPAWPTDRRIPASIFPHRRMTKDGPGAPLLTEQNVERMLLAYDVRPWFDVIMKQPRAEGAGAPVGVLGRNSLLVVRATSLANLNGLPAGDALKTMVAGEAFKHPRNPVTEWLDGLDPWDGATDHIKLLAGTVVVDDEEEEVWKRILRLHMIQSCAAADGATRTSNIEARPQYGYVLVFYGGQGVRKDTWFRAYVGPDMQAYYSAAQSMNPGNKDDIIQNTSMWIVSLNEIDAIFSQSDQSMLKGFLDRTRDQYRVPYGIAFEDWPRRTSFTGTVNQHEFLRDPTGGRRFWPVEVLHIVSPAPDLVRRAWAQAWALYLAGEQWWPDETFEDELNRHRAAYTQMAEVAQAFVARYGYPTPRAKGGEERAPSGEVWLQPAEIYREVFGRPAGNDHKGLSMLGSWLTKNNLDRRGKPDFKKVRGLKYWRVPPCPAPPPSGRLPDESA